MAKSHFVQREVKLFQDLMLVSAIRGTDSCGMFAVGTKKGFAKGSLAVQMNKTTSSVQALLNYENSLQNGMFDDLTKRRVLVGHTRSATIGKISKENAHPFNFANVIGVQNGTINKNFTNYQKFETDTEGLYALISDVGIEKALKEVGSAGAYALVYYDKQDKTMNFIRNSSRPLWMTVPAAGLLAWASTKELLVAALYNNSYKDSDLRSGWSVDAFKDSKFIQLAEHVLMKIPVLDANFDKLETYTKKIEVLPPVTYYQSPTSGYYRRDEYKEEWDAWEKETAEKPLVPKVLSPEEKKKLKSEKKAAGVPTSFVKIHGGEYVSRAALGKLFAELKGCSFCSTDFDENDPNIEKKIHWWGKDILICDDCYENTSGKTGWIKETMKGEESAV